MKYRFAFTVTPDDLLDAPRAHEARGKSPRPGFRYVLLGFALFMAFGPVVSVLMGVPLVKKRGIEFARDLFVWYGACMVVWLWILRPWFARLRLRRSPSQDVVLEFGERGILVEVPATTLANTYSWRDLNEIVPSEKGILLYFGDRVNWIPKRAFSSEDEWRSFLEFALAQHGKARKAPNDDGQREPSPVIREK